MLAYLFIYLFITLLFIYILIFFLYLFLGFGSIDHEKFLNSFISLGPLLTVYKSPNIEESNNNNKNINDKNNQNNENNEENEKTKIFENASQGNAKLFSSITFLISLGIVIVSFVFFVIALKNLILERMGTRRLGPYEHVYVDVNLNLNKNDNKNENYDTDNENVRTYGSMNMTNQTGKHFIQNENQFNI